MPKKILLISYYWPPSGGSGVQRWMFFAKYLKELGHHIEVITVDPKLASYSSTDESFLKHVKDIYVHKTKTFELIRLYSYLKSGDAKKAIPQGDVGSKKKTIIDKMSTYIRANYFIPDARVGWNPYAYKKSCQILDKTNFDILVTTGPPHSTHLIGLKLKRKYEIKWMADFRDPWTEVYYNDIFKKTKRTQKKDQKFELEVLNNADHVLTIGPSMKNLLAKKVSHEKITFIYNGFDEELLRNVKSSNKEGYHISYVGTLSSNYPYKSLITALSQIKYDNVTLNLAGKISEDILNEFFDLKNIKCKYFGIISHQESFNLMVNSDVNVLLLPEQKDSEIMITGKVFEYLASGNKILSIGALNSDAVQLIKKYSPKSSCIGLNEKINLDDLIKANDNEIKLDFDLTRKKLSKELENILINF